MPVKCPINKNREICYDLISTANYLEKLANKLSNSEELIVGKFKKPKDVPLIFDKTERKLNQIIEEITEKDIHRDIVRTTTKAILAKMRKYMFYLFEDEEES